MEPVKSPFHLLHKFIRDLLVLAGSILIAFILVRVGAIETFLKLTGGSSVLSAFIAGGFFTSIFTVAPAAIGLVEIGKVTSPLFVAFVGAFGAMAVDVVIASFVRKDIAEDLGQFANSWSLRRHFLEGFHFGFLKWIALTLGVFFIALPFPDEIGLFFIGLSKIKSPFLPLLFYAANFVGILTLVSIALAV